MPRHIPIQFRRGTSTEWTNENPVLISGEPGFDTQINSLKIGDGSTPYNNIPILFSGIYLQNIIEDNSPALGNNLDLNNYDIVGIGNINISGDITADSGNFNQIIFNTGLEDPNLLAGQLQWNATEGTLDLGLNDNYAMHLGEELLYRVRNITGSTLLAGQPVYASGLSPGANNRIEVALYAADGSIREIRFMGLITEDLTDNGNNGFATQFGYIRGVDTRGDAATYGTTDKLWASGEPAWNEGDILYVHPSVPGKLTKIEPKHSISVAIITSKGSNGKLFVRPTSYGHLDDNHDVSVSGATNGQFLQYNSATDYWVPSSSGNFTTLQVNGAYTFPIVDGSSGQALITDGAGHVSWTNLALNQTVNGRLTLESGVPVSTTNQTAKTTLYFTPYLGNQIAIYNGIEWKIYSFSELSLSLSGYTANTNYDIFIYDNSGTLTLDSTAWTNDTTRATNIVLQDGIYVKSGSTTRRYLGTIRITGTTGQCEDSFSRRFVWNQYNQIEKVLSLNYFPGTTHTYTTSAWRSWNNNTTVGETRLQLVRGLNLSPLETKVWSEMINGWSSIAVDSTSVANSYFKANSGSTGAADSLNKFLDIAEGYHYLQTLEYGTTGSTFYSLFVQASFLG